MQTTTVGIVIRERPIGEKDKVITILTKDIGVVEAIVRGVRNTKSRLLLGVSLFTYSEFVINEGKNNIYINDASEKHSFHSVSDDIEKMSLVFYLAELVKVLNPTGEESNDFLRLFLNSLHFISNSERSLKLVKSVFELKACEYIGLMPNITSCSVCGLYEADEFYFSPRNAELHCKDCRVSGDRKLNIKALMAMRFILLNNIEKVFNFAIDDASMNLLSEAAEDYIKTQTSERFKTLDFYNSIIKGN